MAWWLALLVDCWFSSGGLGLRPGCFLDASVGKSSRLVHLGGEPRAQAEGMLERLYHSPGLGTPQDPPRGADGSGLLPLCPGFPSETTAPDGGQQDKNPWISLLKVNLLLIIMHIFILRINLKTFPLCMWYQIFKNGSNQCGVKLNQQIQMLVYGNKSPNTLMCFILYFLRSVLVRRGEFICFEFICFDACAGSCACSQTNALLDMSWDPDSNVVYRALLFSVISFSPLLKLCLIWLSRTNTIGIGLVSKDRLFWTCWGKIWTQ